MRLNAFESTLLGNAPELKTVLRAAALVAATDAAVLVLGESGTGKDLLARAIHRESRRADRPFHSVNCAALPDSLADSELFGHRKGAFTGAVADQTGRLCAASGGTLLLDEVGDLSLPVQAKLLRFLESGECQPVGATATTRADVRVIAATHRDLPAAVRAGRFRADLYYRLHVVPLVLPPLRERGSDVRLLVGHLTAELARQHGLTPPRYTPAALELIARHPWPGNVRELRNLCERMLILLPGREVGPENLPAEVRLPAGPPGEEFTLPATGVSLEGLEVQLIRQALQRTRGNRSQAARLVGLTRDALLYRLKKHAIEA
ncbi:MAG: sigma-54 dependent transcriptional regulator [Gammaproteobacteria bacterium]|jgi:DNA-binding NtrC family response regulator|nr:sigma-54 dependent transcriptional regulator [Gammaproteobacteria bacterium]